jgi:Mrp family chromosome partitioning ATPase
MRFNLSQSLPSLRTSATSLAVAERKADAAEPAYQRSEFAEQFRLLALNIMSLIGGETDRSLAVFSISPGDGRSLIATNLSLALTAHSDVVLVGNGSLSGVHKQLLDPFEVGDGERALVPKKTAEDELHRLWLLRANASSVTGTEQLIPAEVETSGDRKFLIVDAPAASRSAEAFALAQKCKNVLYVMPKGITDLEPHRRALEQLGRLHTRVVGIVLNEN